MTSVVSVNLGIYFHGARIWAGQRICNEFANLFFTVQRIWAYAIRHRLTHSFILFFFTVVTHGKFFFVCSQKICLLSTLTYKSRMSFIQFQYVGIRLVHKMWPFLPRVSASLNLQIIYYASLWLRRFDLLSRFLPTCNVIYNVELPMSCKSLF